MTNMVKTNITITSHDPYILNWKHADAKQITTILHDPVTLNEKHVYIRYKHC